MTSLSHRRRFRFVARVGLSLTFALFAHVGADALASCASPPPGVTNPVTFLSPANGSFDVTRFPAMTVKFCNTISADPATLGAGIQLFDRAGTLVPLFVRRSASDDHVAVAVPASTANRLNPTADYVLEVTLGTTVATAATRAHFMTGGVKSIFCLRRDTDDWSNINGKSNVCTAAIGGQEPTTSWESLCDENYFARAAVPPGPPVCNTGDPAANWTCLDTTVPPVLGTDPDSGATCCCYINRSVTVMGGDKGVCDCNRESQFLTGSPSFAYALITATTPVAGSGGVAPNGSIVLTLDRDIGSSASSYVLRVEDITQPDTDPTAISTPAPVYSAAARTFTITGPSLLANHRYRVILQLSSAASVPTTRILTPAAHRFDWTFNTWTGHVGHLTQYLPSEKPDGVSFPTALPRWPHLRFLFDAPVPTGLSDLDPAPLTVRKSTGGGDLPGTIVWIDQEMSRLHLMAYRTLDEGFRYDVYCSSQFAAILGTSCNTTPIARFSTQVTPPDSGPSTILVGTGSLGAPGEYLPVRPTVLNQPYGYKERWTVDGQGPLQFDKFVMLIPSAPTDTIATIHVNPAAGCKSISHPQEACISPYYLASTTSCTSDANCAAVPDYRCKPCPASGANASCPTGQSRCQWWVDDFQTDLTKFCRDVIDGGQTACNIEDVYRCLGGGSTDCIDNFNKMNALYDFNSCPVGETKCCPSTHKLNAGTDTSCCSVPNCEERWNCVPTGKIAVNFSAGTHVAPPEARWDNACSYDPTEPGNVNGFVRHPAPVVLQPEVLSGNEVVRAIYSGAKNLPATGLLIPTEACQTKGYNIANSPTYVCPSTGGICDTSANPPRCQLIEQGREPETLGTCVAPSYTCPAGYDCNEGLCKRPCSLGCSPGYLCDVVGYTTYCSRPVGPVALSSDVLDLASGCFKGFTNRADPSGDFPGHSVCVASTGTVSGEDGPAFSCTGGGDCTARWVKIQGTDNIYRIWWPSHSTQNGSRGFDFIAQTVDATGAIAGIPVLRNFTRDDCLFTEDFNTCALSQCAAWNLMTYPEQISKLLQWLRWPTRPAPYGVWATGRRIITALADQPDGTCSLGSTGSFDPTSEKDVDGPEGLFVKLPAGKTPADYNLSGSKDYVLTYFTNIRDLTVRGLTFTGFPSGLYTQYARRQSYRGNQFLGVMNSGLQSVSSLFSPPDGTGPVTIDYSDNFSSVAQSLHGEASIHSMTVNNNVFWRTAGKAMTIQTGLAPTPTVCTTDVGNQKCVKPTCRANHNEDCRIPFWDGVPGTLLTDDPANAGLAATCGSVSNGIGTCSHGVLDQRLFMDNVMLESTGLQGPWSSLRIQRNHFENEVEQELIDGISVDRVSFLDNVVFNSRVAQGMGFPAFDAQTRGVAIENNFVLSNVLGYKPLIFSKAFPADAAGWTFGWGAVNHGGGNVSDAKGLRFTGNTVLGRAAGAEFGDIGLVEPFHWQNMRMVDNSIVLDTHFVLSNPDYEQANFQSSGTFANNLILSSTRRNPEESLCSLDRGGDVSVWGYSQLVPGQNAFLFNGFWSWNPNDIECLRNPDRRSMFREPLPASPMLDYELFQRRIIQSQQEGPLYHQWPSYDPALLDDALHVRPSRSECATYGAFRSDCVNLDTDRDLYASPGDNCPGASNSTQTDTDGDGAGDACDATVMGTNFKDGSTAATNKVCNLPGGIASGDLLLLALRSSGDETHSTPSGWSPLVLNNTSDASDDRTSIWYRKANGMEGSTVTVNGTVSLKFSCLSWRITGAADPAVQPPQASPVATATNNAPNPLPLSPTGGAKLYVWIWLGGWEGKQTSPPAGTPICSPSCNPPYSNKISANSGSSGTAQTNCRLASATRNLNASTEDPGIWLLSASDDWTAYTIAVHPSM